MAELDADAVDPLVLPAWIYDQCVAWANEATARIRTVVADESRRRRRAENRLSQSGPGKMERQVAHAFRIKPRLLGIGPPPLAIDGRAYRQRQRNRVKRRRR